MTFLATDLAFKATFATLDAPIFYLSVHLLNDRGSSTDDELAAVGLPTTYCLLSIVGS